MGFRQNPYCWMILAVSASWVNSGFSQAQYSEFPTEQREVPRQRVAGATAPRGTTLIPEIPEFRLEQVPPPLRDGVRRTLSQPTLFTHGPSEVFHGQPAFYHWLLDHPDQAVRLWRSLGAKCMEITDRGNGRFGWADGEGSELHWDTVFQSALFRVWYAEGSVRPAPLLPTVSVRAVVVLRHADSSDRVGAAVIHHQANMYVHSDSKTVAIITRLMGASAPRIAEQCVAQLEMFFSALVWYLDQHPEVTQALLSHPPQDRTRAGDPGAAKLSDFLYSSGNVPVPTSD
jgi:hypothetical protein